MPTCAGGLRAVAPQAHRTAARTARPSKTDILPAVRRGNGNATRHSFRLEKQRMTHDVWLNLPVSDLPQSIAFFTAVGFTPNPGPGNSAHSASFTIGTRKTVLMLFAN